jgi:1,3-beta-glucanosyltransferase GAS5
MTRPLTEVQYFTEGAGKGPGLKGSGSQWAGDSASTSDGGSGTGTGTDSSSSSTSSSAAIRGTVPALDKAPLIVSGLVALFTLVGAAAL